jgi:hypothetical protein
MAAIVLALVVSLYHSASFDASAFNLQDSTVRGPGALIVGKGE